MYAFLLALSRFLLSALILRRCVRDVARGAWNKCLQSFLANNISSSASFRRGPFCSVAMVQYFTLRSACFLRRRICNSLSTAVRCARTLRSLHRGRPVTRVRCQRWSHCPPLTPALGFQIWWRPTASPCPPLCPRTAWWRSDTLTIVQLTEPANPAIGEATGARLPQCRSVATASHVCACVCLACQGVCRVCQRRLHTCTAGRWTKVGASSAEGSCMLAAVVSPCSVVVAVRLMVLPLSGVSATVRRRITALDTFSVSVSSVRWSPQTGPVAGVTWRLNRDLASCGVGIALFSTGPVAVGRRV